MGQDPLRHGHLILTRGLLQIAGAKELPHADACLTCPLFLTGPELREHRVRTLILISKSEATDHTRVAEMNQTVLTNLDKMIGQLNDEPDGDKP